EKGKGKGRKEEKGKGTTSEYICGSPLLTLFRSLCLLTFSFWSPADILDKRSNGTFVKTGRVCLDSTGRGKRGKGKERGVFMGGTSRRGAFALLAFGIVIAGLEGSLRAQQASKQPPQPKLLPAPKQDAD